MSQTGKPVRLIALDLDGTLLRSDSSISERALRAIGEARARGVKVTVATGRMFATSVGYVKEIGVDIPFVTSQGAMIRTVDGKIISHDPVPSEMARQVVDYALTHGHHVNVYVDDLVYVQKDGKIVQEYSAKFSYLYQVCDLLTLLEDRVPTKVLILEDPAVMPALQASLNQLVEGKLHMVLSEPSFLEINHKDINKWKSVETIGGMYGIAGDEIMAIGDSLNDLEMVRDAGWGVAMGNAMEEVKRSARLLTESNDQDGAAKAIERWALNRDIAVT
ncbi:MAG: Cof-type HAD-IIB family hydrolase [Peptococcaceae bacterium]|nr:Cof-type HAD-IIB family hydrolase [Peptococcaceae bacterium]